MGLVVRKPGVYTSVQDNGRYGYQGSGFSPNGVMDHRAYVMANLLVENDPHDCVLEFALAGPTLRFTTKTIIALTGGDFSATIDRKPVPRYTALMVDRGSILRLGAAKTGCYGYLAIAGGSMRIPEVMGSRSTNLKCEIGGWKGRTLIVGDYLPFVTKNVDFLPNLGSHRIDPDPYYCFGEEEITVRVVPGPQENLFTEEGIEAFYSQTYLTTTKCDRMGYRLDGPEIATACGSDIISDGIAFGAVQVPSHGRPIIMLADRQTTGGYAKIGTIATVDIPKLVQRPPGSRIRFEAVTVQEAQALLRAEARQFEGLALRVRRPSADGISPRRTARRLAPILEEQARKSQANTLWINQADRAERVGNRNLLHYDETAGSMKRVASVARTAASTEQGTTAQQAASAPAVAASDEKNFKE
ncbi:MAG: biotin-dependent carboxyltransferase family protein [Gordonibacter sp.]